MQGNTATIIIVGDLTSSVGYDLEEMAMAMEELVLADPYNLECELPPDEIREEVCNIFLTHYQSHIRIRPQRLVRIRSPDRVKIMIITKLNGLFTKN